MQEQINFHTLEADDWINDADADSTQFWFQGSELDLTEFQTIRSPWGDAPNADELERLGVDGWLARGAGNGDPYFYVVRLDHSHGEHEVALTSRVLP